MRSVMDYPRDRILDNLNLEARPGGVRSFQHTPHDDQMVKVSRVTHDVPD